jgi:hypothetical protein
MVKSEMEGGGVAFMKSMKQDSAEKPAEELMEPACAPIMVASCSHNSKPGK